MSLTGTVSLSYDGGSLCHLETVLPQLNEFSLRGTFYVDPVSLLENLPEWGDAVSKGHEIGNGSLLVTPIENWSKELVIEDAQSAKELIDDLFPEQNTHTIALPWGMSEFDFDILKMCGYDTAKSNVINSRSMFAHNINAMCAKEILALVQSELQRSPSVILAFQGVGSGDPAIDAKAHREFCEQLSLSPDLAVVPVSKVSADSQTRPAGLPHLA